MTNFRSLGEHAIETPDLRVELRPLVRLVYLWMGFGLLVTALVSAMTAANDTLRELLTNELVLFAALTAELVLVGVLSTGIHRMSFGRAVLIFTVYAAINGFTLGIVFMAFSGSAIVLAFTTTAALFTVMALVGFVIHIDLTRYGAYFFMGLIGMLIALIVNVVIGSHLFELVISMVGVVLFTGLTAYDSQKIKKLAAEPEIQTSIDLTLKLSILGALELYLDFINLFLFLLRLFGQSDE